MKSSAASQKYHSVNQMTIPGFETPFSRQLDPNNRWVKLSMIIPWDALVGLYDKTLKGTTGRPPKNGRVIMGAMIIKHYCDFSDEETILNIQENMYMQYFCGYSSYDPSPAFDSSLFVEIRDRLGISGISAMNDLITLSEKKDNISSNIIEKQEGTNGEENGKSCEGLKFKSETEQTPPIEESIRKGRVLYDATACPQEIAYPTDLNLLNDCREKSEWMIDFLYPLTGWKDKPRTYRQTARKEYLKTAQSKKKTKAKVNVAIGKQLRFLKRNYATITKMLNLFGDNIPFDKKMLKYYWVIQCCYEQQLEMHKSKTQRVDDRIVSIHQPHVRPIVRGKANAKVEFGCKINVSMVEGLAYIDKLSWDAFNEGSHLMDYVYQYKSRHGYFPKEVLADKIYCTRENRKQLKEHSIVLIAKPLGRPKAVPEQHVSPGERNEIEGKFGQGKRAYGMDKIRAKLKQTSETWVAMIVLVLNLVKLAGRASLALLFKVNIREIILSSRISIGSRKILAYYQEYCTISRIRISA